METGEEIELHTHEKSRDYNFRISKKHTKTTSKKEEGWEDCRVLRKWKDNRGHTWVDVECKQRQHGLNPHVIEAVRWVFARKICICVENTTIVILNTNMYFDRYSILRLKTKRLHGTRDFVRCVDAPRLNRRSCLLQLCVLTLSPNFGKELCQVQAVDDKYAWVCAMEEKGGCVRRSLKTIEK